MTSFSLAAGAVCNLCERYQCIASFDPRDICLTDKGRYLLYGLEHAVSLCLAQIKDHHAISHGQALTCCSTEICTSCLSMQAQQECRQQSSSSVFVQASWGRAASLDEGTIPLDPSTMDRVGFC